MRGTSASFLVGAGALFVVVASVACRGERTSASSRPSRVAAASDEAPASTPTFVGSSACTECHAREATAWRGSDHQLAMQVADPSTILGDFRDRSLDRYGETMRMFRRDERAYQHVEGEDGRSTDFPVAYVFGVRPLQQYLASLGRGRYGVLPAVWDARSPAEGGQRWFHLHSEEAIRAGDELHWTARAQAWSHQCAECHVTDFRKGYTAATDAYDTKQSELGVGCEACHGPGSAHVAEARRVASGGPWIDSKRHGFPIAFDERRGVSFAWSDSDRKPLRSAPPASFRTEVETCARCHSRRGQIWGEYRFGRSLLDTHRPALLDAPLYFADGQVREEDYEYGSFLQSAMYARGVTCSDCHDPHDQHVRDDGNGLCTQCHSPQRYDAASHTFHRAGTPGSACVDCHMTKRTYMVVDERRDHGFRVPRPDVSERTGAPNACNGCHANRGARWAARAVERWYGVERRQGAHFADAFAALQRGAPDASVRLLGVASDAGLAPIVRATALRALAAYPSSDALRVVEHALASADPLLRLGALGALEGVPPADRIALAAPLLSDEVRALRLEAVGALADLPVDRLPPSRRHAFAAALAEARASLSLDADQPIANLNRGTLEARQGRLADAEAAYRRAIERDPRFVAAYVNLADLYRERGDDTESEALLRRAVTLAPRDANVHFALALALVRLRRYDDAEPELARALTLAPGDARIEEALVALRRR